MMKRASVLCVALAGIFGWAAFGAVEDVPAFVERWSAQGRRLGLPSGRKVVRVVRHEIGGTAPAFHEARFAGGGFAVVDSNEPDGEVIAFSDRGEVVEDDKNPLWVMLKRHMMLKATEGVLVKSSKQTTIPQTKISDLRVMPLLESKWNQLDADGRPCYKLLYAERLLLRMRRDGDGPGHALSPVAGAPLEDRNERVLGRA